VVVAVVVVVVVVVVAHEKVVRESLNLLSGEKKVCCSGDLRLCTLALPVNVGCE